MLLRVLCLALCALVANAVECPNSDSVTPELRKIIIGSNSPSIYDCTVEAQVQKDLDSCAKSSGNTAEFSSNSNDHKANFKKAKEMVTLNEGAKVGCGYGKMKCEGMNTVRCVWRGSTSAASGAGSNGPRKPVQPPGGESSDNKKASKPEPGNQSGSSSSSSSIQCPNSQMTPDARKAVLDAHNEYRSKQALGKVRDDVPKVRNMYKMSYSCALEAEAQKQVSGCKNQHTKDLVGGENLYGASNSKVPPLVDSVVDAANSWWKEVDDIGRFLTPNSESLVYTRALRPIGHYTVMARHDQLKIGCGYQYCDIEDWYHVTCRYGHNNMLNEAVLVFGEPCKADSDCTTHPESTCIASKGLCSVNGESDQADGTSTSTRAIYGSFMLLVPLILH